MITIDVDDEMIKRIRRTAPKLSIPTYLRGRLRDLDRMLSSDSPGEVYGVLIVCPRCGHEWNYGGKAYRARCERCGRNIRTHLKFVREDIKE